MNDAITGLLVNRTGQSLGIVEIERKVTEREVVRIHMGSGRYSAFRVEAVDVQHALLQLVERK